MKKLFYILFISLFIFSCEKEKKTWKDPSTSDEWKKENIIEIQKRMNGWQLESFKESYNYKTKNGISLFKKKLINESK